MLGDRYLSRGGDPGSIDDQPWDLSVKALARYPGVLQMMNDYFEWTTALGAAFVYQQQEVMDEIQRLRAAALDLGNLQSTLQQNVIVEDGFIEILPAEADVIYVPQYPPDIVYTQGSVGAPWILFGAGYAMGAWMDRDFDWPRRRLLIWDHIYSRPADWWSSRRPTPPDREGPENPSGRSPDATYPLPDPAGAAGLCGYFGRPGRPRAGSRASFMGRMPSTGRLFRGLSASQVGIASARVFMEHLVDLRELAARHGAEAEFPAFGWASREAVAEPCFYWTLRAKGL